MKVNLIHIIIVFLILVSGCARPPIAEMENAREAVFRAENDPDAVLYAGSVLARARSSLQRMETEAENKRFDAVKIHAEEAVSASERAIADGRQGAERARNEAAALLSGLRPEVVETERNINGARYSQLDLDYNELERGIVNAHESIDRAEVSQTEGRYQDVMDIARNVRMELSNINGRVASATTTVKK